MERLLRRLYPRWLPEELLWPLVLLACMAVAETVTLIFFGRHLAMRRMLLWNIFLSGIPFLVACGVVYFDQKQIKKKRLLSVILWPLWLLFFPNAPYMLTDLIHLRWYQFYISGVGFTDKPAAWFGLLHLFTGVAAGTAIGMLSLRLLHNIVARRCGKMAGWCFAAGACALSGVGVWIGRCLRFNSWDALQRPDWLLREILAELDMRVCKTIVIFAALAAVAYLLLYVFTIRTEAERSR